jgi:hypothetical protein
MSLRAISWAMEVACPSPAAKLVLLVLCDAHNGHTGDCYPSLGRIVASTGLSEAGVKKSIRAMEAVGMLQRIPEHDHSGRTKGVRYVLDIGGRGHTVTPPCDGGEGSHSNPSEGAHSNPTRGHTVTPLIEPERRTGNKPEDIPSAAAQGVPAKASSKGKKENRAPDYHGDFEMLWAEFPRHPNSSKAEAHAAWLRLPVGDRDPCFDAARIFAKRVADERQELRFVPHLVKWINGRRFETILEAAE